VLSAEKIVEIGMGGVKDGIGGDGEIAAEMNGG